MPGGDIYQAWANATPTTPFPFQYSDKKVGKIQQSWADVRAGIQKDAISTTLPFCTSHITPTILQVNIIADAIKKETQFQKRWEHESAARSRAASGNASPVSFNGSDASSSSAVRRALRSAQEQDALVNSEGGRGRKAYLKLRQLMEPKERFQGRPRTAAHQYGWNIETTKDTEAQFRSLSSALSATHGSSSLSNTHGSPVLVGEDRKALNVSAQQTRGVNTKPSVISAAEANLSEALLRERQHGSHGDVATSLTMGRTSSPKHRNGDFRRNNTLQNDRRASGVFSKHH
jgi:hypothetical protein